MLPAKTPRILWVELTSKCPFDCIFCSRKSRRSSGEHMPFALFESLVRQVTAPRTFLLNYSGESTVYPELIPAIRLARSTGAGVELVTALASAPDHLLSDLSTAGLTRLTISVHAADEVGFAEIYRHSSFTALRTRLEMLVELCQGARQPPAIDLAFVAMQQNLDQLNGVAEMAGRLGLRAISLFPVIRRDEIPIVFPRELTGGGTHRHEFREDLIRRVEDSRRRFPGIAFMICNPHFTDKPQELGMMPAACPGELPAGARIHSCEQNPWETAHVLSNGDVVACEVHDRVPLGNLARQTLADIWDGEAYAQFRRDYHTGELPPCRSCPWKNAYLPQRMQSEILGARGRNAQLGYGWHEPDGAHIWSSQQAVAWLEPRPGSRLLHVGGILPPGHEAEPNRLEVCCNGVLAGTVENAGAEMMPFGVDFPAGDPMTSRWNIEFHTRFVYRPRDRGAGMDNRDLGFALVLAASQAAPVDPVLSRRQSVAVHPLFDAVPRIDRLGRALRSQFLKRSASERANRLRPGISVVIPERNHVDELASCLAGLRTAAHLWQEPVEVLVVVNGSGAGVYRELRMRYPEVQWQFHDEPLGFGGAVKRGLRRARYDWTYLLNSDVVLEQEALVAAGRQRDASVFSIASQIFLKDATRFREETNWTALLIEDGLVATHDLIPQSAGTVEHFYAGGGASLFQTRLLREFLDAAAYHPFYWEDVEWGWRARKLGYRSLFCPSSIVHHTQGATITRYYSREAIETIILRNRLLFQLRNFTTVGSLEAVAEAISRTRPEVAAYFAGWSALAAVGRARLWNHVAPVSDEEVLASTRVRG